jgi:hypothetical protein
VVVTAWVVPGAARNEVTGRYGEALRVRVSAPAAEGKANRAAALLVAAAVGGREGEVIAGHGARRKQVLVRGVTLRAAAADLAALLSAR